MKKNVLKVSLGLLVCICLFFSKEIYANSINVSGNKTATPGSTVNVNVGGSFTGRVNITVSNGSGNTSVWIENNVITIPIIVGNSGTTTINAISEKGTSDNNGQDIGIIKGNFSISIIQPSTPPANTNNNNNTANTNVKTNTNTTNNTNTKTNTAKNNNAYLSKLQVNQEGLTPNFNKNKTSYAITVGENVDSLKVTATPEASTSKVSISGNTNLKNGDNKIYVTVTAQDGTKKVYTITVTKTGDPVKANSFLESLIVENATMSPEFSKEVFEYDCGTVGASVDNLKILAFGENENVKVDIIGNDKLVEGDNTITVKVTSEDGTTTKDYVIKVKKDSTIVDEKEFEEINSLQDTGADSLLKNILKRLKANWLVCLMYILIIVEFIEIIYLYRHQAVKVKKEKKNGITKDITKNITLDKEFKQNKKLRKKLDDIDNTKKDLNVSNARKRSGRVKFDNED